jgi:hypothetical protein
MTIELYEQLLLELERAKSPVLSYLQPGISKKDVDNILKLEGIDISLPDEVYDLYGWKNGIYDEEANTRSLGQLTLFTLGIFVSFNIAAVDYRERAVQYNYWPRGLFPLFGSGGGDYYLIDTNKQSVNFRMILFYSPSNPSFQGTVSAFDSLDSCLRSIIECYREKVYYIEPGSPYFESGDGEWAIRRKHNPRSEYYRISDKFA